MSPPPTLVTALRRALRTHLPWSKPKLEVTSQFVQALLRARSVNLMDLSRKMVTPAKPSSSFKRLQRFMRSFSVPQADVARMVTDLLAPEGEWILSLDRTNWKFGEQDCNFLVLALVRGRSAIPLFFKELGK